MIVKVYFETIKGSYAEEIATFTDEEYFDACYPILEKIAEKHGYILTESLIEENEDEDILSEGDFSQLEEQKYHVEENEDE